MESFVKANNVNMAEESEVVYVPLTETVKYFENRADKALLEYLCTSLVQNFEIDYKNGIVSQEHYKKQAQNIQNWIFQITTLGSSSGNKEEDQDVIIPNFLIEKPYNQDVDPVLLTFLRDIAKMDSLQLYANISEKAINLCVVVENDPNYSIFDFIELIHQYEFNNPGYSFEVVVFEKSEIENDFSPESNLVLKRR